MIKAFCKKCKTIVDCEPERINSDIITAKCPLCGAVLFSETMDQYESKMLRE